MLARQRQRGVGHGQRFLRAVQLRQRMRLAAPRAALEVGLAERVAARFELRGSVQRGVVVAAVERQVAQVFERDGVGARAGQRRQGRQRFVQQVRARRRRWPRLAQRFGGLHQAQADARRPAGRARQFERALHPFERRVVGVQAGEGVRRCWWRR